jgi:pathogenesis-related protein 1
MRWLLIPLTLGVLLPGGAAAVESRPEQARTGMIEAHNAVRDRVHPDLPEMSWSEQAAEQAQEWADTLARNGCRMRHNPDLQDHGQNLFWAGPRREVTVTRSGQTGEIVDREVRTSVQEITAQDVVESWASEKQWYDYEADECRAPEGESCGHYTQIVWADTTEVGCGMSVCEDKGQIWTCDYYPAGNIVGQRPY